MKKIFVFLTILLSVFGCSSSRNSAPVGEQAAAAESKEPKLRITAVPRQGFAELRVNFHGVLEGVTEDDEAYRCLKTEWDFGDGSISSEQPNCPEDLTKIETNFFVEHLYENEGIYTARLTLGEKKIISNKFTVTVLQDSSKF